MFADFLFHHLGYATKSIEETSIFFLTLGYTKSPTIMDPIQNVNIAFLTKVDSPRIELVEPIDDKSPVMNILGKNGVTPYHVCYEVIDIFQAVSDMKKLRFIPLFKPVPAVALDNRLICYLFNKDTGLIELLDK
jgi:methylmalonyl-CoA/ethylmalonyl-CoA epimerase